MLLTDLLVVGWTMFVGAPIVGFCAAELLQEN